VSRTDALESTLKNLFPQFEVNSGNLLQNPAHWLPFGALKVHLYIYHKSKYIKPALSAIIFAQDSDGGDISANDSSDMECCITGASFEMKQRELNYHQHYAEMGFILHPK